MLGGTEPREGNPLGPPRHRSGPGAIVTLFLTLSLSTSVCVLHGLNQGYGALRRMSTYCCSFRRCLFTLKQPPRIAAWRVHTSLGECVVTLIEGAGAATALLGRG